MSPREPGSSHGPLDRRAFVGRMSGLAAALAVGGAPLAACAEGAPPDELPAGEGPAGEGGPGSAPAGAAFGPLGIQLYTLRSLMSDDPRGTLAAVAGIGYEEVEFAGLQGLTPAEMKAALDGLGLRAVSSHESMAAVRERMPELTESANTLGQGWITVPSLPRGERNADFYRALADDFNRAGEAARAAGLRFAFHNHSEVFRDLGGEAGFDILLARTDPALVDYQLDIYWAVEGGRDPLAIFAAHPGRFPMIHAKDRTPEGGMVDVGAGALDFAAILAAREVAGLRHVLVEHDRPGDPLESARASYAALAAIRI